MHTCTYTVHVHVSLTVFGATHHVLLCVAAGLDPKALMEAIFKHFNLDQNTIDFIGCALALYRDDGEFMHLCYD